MMCGYNAVKHWINVSFDAYERTRASSLLLKGRYATRKQINHSYTQARCNNTICHSLGLKKHHFQHLTKTNNIFTKMGWRFEHFDLFFFLFIFVARKKGNNDIKIIINFRHFSWSSSTLTHFFDQTSLFVHPPILYLRSPSCDPHKNPFYIVLINFFSLYLQTFDYCSVAIAILTITTTTPTK